MTFRVWIEGCPVFTGCSAKEADALVKTARSFPSPDGKSFGAPRIDVREEDSIPKTRYPSGR